MRKSIHTQERMVLQMAGKRRDSGVFQLADGNWGYRFKALIEGRNVDRRRIRDNNGKPFKNKTAASKARKQALEDAYANAGTLDLPVGITPPANSETVEEKTVADVFAEFCAKGRSDRAYQTIRKQDSLWKNHLAERFGARRLDSLTTAEIQDFLTTLYYENDFSYSYVESFLKMFYLIFGQAYSRGYLETAQYHRLCLNKDTKIRMPKRKRNDEDEVVVFSEEECAILDAYFKGTNAETAYLLGRYCGLRINECYGLKWSQVNLEKGTIRIDQQEQYQDGIIKLVPLKTRNARRTVYLPEKVREHLRARYQEIQEAERTDAIQRQQKQTFVVDVNGEWLSCLELVNTLPNGTIQTINSMKYHARTLKQTYGIHFKYHFLRHTYGTHLAMTNTPIHVLCNQMGHGKIDTTKKYYIGLSKRGVDTLLKNLNTL